MGSEWTFAFPFTYFVSTESIIGFFNTSSEEFSRQDLRYINSKVTKKWSCRIAWLYYRRNHRMCSIKDSCTSVFRNFAEFPRTPFLSEHLLCLLLIFLWQFNCGITLPQCLCNTMNKETRSWSERSSGKIFFSFLGNNTYLQNNMLHIKSKNVTWNIQVGARNWSS